MDRVQFLQSLDGWDLHSEIREGWDWEFHNCVVFSQTMLQSVSIGSTIFSILMGVALWQMIPNAIGANIFCFPSYFSIEEPSMASIW